MKCRQPGLLLVPDIVVESLSRVWLFVTPGTVAHQAPLFMGFSRQGYWSWTIKKAECWRTDAFELGYWRRLLRVPWTARSNHWILKEISPEYSLEGLMLKLKLQYFGHLMRRTGKNPDAGKDWRQEEKGMTEDEMLGWHQWLSVHEFEPAPGVGEGQGSLACCSPWGLRVRHNWATELNWTEKLHNGQHDLNLSASHESETSYFTHAFQQYSL